jgi:hypothetical protein
MLEYKSQVSIAKIFWRAQEWIERNSLRTNEAAIDRKSCLTSD